MFPSQKEKWVCLYCDLEEVEGEVEGEVVKLLPKVKAPNSSETRQETER